MNTQLRILSAAALLGALLAPIAQGAEDADAAARVEMFKTLDVDGNGVLTAEEAEGDPKVAEEFPHADANEDGVISLDEMMNMKFSDE